MDLANYKLILLLIVMTMQLPSIALGRQSDSLTPTIYLNTAYGFSTYKSKLVASNDTSTALSYEIGGYAGNDGSIGFALRTTTTATTFELNSSSNSISWQDTILKYRFWYLYLGPVFTTVTYAVNAEGTDLIEATGTGMGANLGLMIPISSKGAFSLDILSVSQASLVNKLETEASIASRLDIDLGGTVQLSKSINFLFGYQQNSHQVSTTSSFVETFLLTYFGFRFHYSF